MGINLNNFLNSNLNQHVVDVLREASVLKNEWRQHKSEDSINNVFKRDDVNQWLTDNPQLNVLFRDNRESFAETFGKYHFTINADDFFYYVWKFNYNNRNFYLYASNENATVEADRSASTAEIQGFLESVGGYLK